MGAIDFLCRPLSRFQPGESVQSAKRLSADTFSTQRSDVFFLLCCFGFIEYIEGFVLPPPQGSPFILLNFPSVAKTKLKGLE